MRFVTNGILPPYTLPATGMNGTSVPDDIFNANLTDGFTIKLAQTIADHMNAEANYT